MAEVAVPLAALQEGSMDPATTAAAAPAAATADPVAAASPLPVPSSASAEAPAVTQEAQPAEVSPAPVNPQLEAVNDQFKAAQEEPSNFDLWTKLVSATEKLGDIAKLREVYDAFLAEFPLCYGYWKKYADAELRNSLPDQAAAVFERGVAAVPYSVDLWGVYATFKQNQHASADEVRGVFEQGLAYVGTDFLSHTLWDKYITFELSQSATLKVAQLYERILASPIRDLDRYHNGFKEFASSRQAQTMLPPEEFSRISDALLKEKTAAAEAQSAKQAQQAAVTVPAAVGTDTAMPDVQSAATADAAVPVGDAAAGAVPLADAAPASDDTATAQAPVSAAPAEQMELDTAAGTTAAVVPEAAAAGAAAAVQPPPAAQPVEVSDDEVKASWLAGQEAVYQATRQEQGRRQPFETVIKRPYFHIKPLDNAQLLNWSRYLDYMEKLGDPGATLRLYERCLVPCASYPEYWIRYVRYLEASGDGEGARGALQRATLVHCKRQHTVHLFAALFEERHGDLEAARAAYTLVQGKLAPGLLAATVQHANFERRSGSRQAACAAFGAALEREGGAVEGAGSDTYPFLVLFYAAFLQAAFQDAVAARAVYTEALTGHPGILRLWEGAIAFEEGVPGPDQSERVMNLYKRALAAGGATPSLTEADRETLSERSVSFADLHCDAAGAEQAAAAHAVLLRSLEKTGGALDSKKRAAEGTPSAGGPAAKQAKSQPAQQVTPSPASAAVQTPPAQAVSPYYGQPGAYNYSGYYPSYPPAQQYPTYPGYAGYQ